MNPIKLHIAVCIAALLAASACTGRYSFIPGSAGENTDVLVRVLDHYADDTTSAHYAAARFLIENMGWHYSYEADGIHPDAGLLSYEFLTTHIDHAVRQWRTSPFAAGLSFEQFCEYLLPYRASPGFGQNVTNALRYRWVVENIGLPDSITDLKAIIHHYNCSVARLRKQGGPRHAAQRDGLNDLFYSDFTDCADMAVHACLNLRAIGIPCVVEHNPGYRTMKSHHYHCAVWDSANGKWIKFSAEETGDYPGNGDWYSPEVMNIYRDTYAPCSDLPYRHDMYAPPGFDSPCRTDVTDATVTVRLDLPGVPDSSIVYLSTFHRRDNGLHPFTAAFVSGGKAIFRHVVPTVWYVATTYPDGIGQVVSRPFWVNDTTGGLPLVTPARFAGSPDTLVNVTLRRKYPLKERLLRRAATLVGTTVCGANRADFSDARLLWTLGSTPPPAVSRYRFHASGPYRYYRLSTPAACEISVLQWLTGDGPVPLSPGDNKAYDGNMTTAPVDSSAINLSLPGPVTITAINLAPVNADNAVTIGHTYELFRWVDGAGWQSVGRKVADSGSLIFPNLPAGALLWLKDLTAGSEEMPFFYRDNTQQFLYQPYSYDSSLWQSPRRS